MTGVMKLIYAMTLAFAAYVIRPRIQMHAIGDYGECLVAYQDQYGITKTQFDVIWYSTYMTSCTFKDEKNHTVIDCPPYIIDQIQEPGYYEILLMDTSATSNYIREQVF
jgi:hypothetical protein